MTLEDIEKMDASTLDITTVADVLDSSAQTIRIQAQEDPRKLGFPVIVEGRRVKIPRLGFLHFMRYGYAIDNKEHLMAIGKGDAHE